MSTVKAALGWSGEDEGKTSAPTKPLPSLPSDACGTLWVAYQRCLYESGGRACDPVKEGIDALCPGFQTPLEGMVREATTPVYALSLPPL